MLIAPLFPVSIIAARELLHAQSSVKTPVPASVLPVPGTLRPTEDEARLGPI
jgi:hypothetical protein